MAINYLPHKEINSLSNQNLDININVSLWSSKIYYNKQIIVLFDNTAFKTYIQMLRKKVAMMSYCLRYANVDLLFTESYPTFGTNK